MNQPLVSIIIPTYNRADFIAETLHSISNQTYQNWECIVVDDGSIDNSAQVVNTYIEKDSRFKYNSRPTNKPKGANSCRNYGFELSKGKYINWFDSDDIMEKNFIQKKVTVLENEKLDFVISHSVNFDANGNESPIFESTNINKEITAENYISNIINWITMDVLATKQSIGALCFRENLKSGQEYNFFSRYLLNKPKGTFIHEYLAKRRVHDNSIQQVLLKDNFKKKKELLFNEMVLLKDIKGKVSKPIIKRSLKRLVRFSYETQKKFTISKVQLTVLKELISYGNLKAVFSYILWIKTNLLFGKGYFWIKLSNLY